MKWKIPAKTFLVGEYAALSGGSAIILTTNPCFELVLKGTNETIEGIHPLSPAGRYWSQSIFSDQGLSWLDPYHEIGGLGASSAQFLAVYLAGCYLSNRAFNLESLLEDYYKYAWDGKGACPSGYDLIAQSKQQCVYINKQEERIDYYSWPFKGLSFLLIHSGKKIRTDEHLKSVTLTNSFSQLSEIAKAAKCSFEKVDEAGLIDAINNYYHKLDSLNLVAEESRHYVQMLHQYDGVMAVKGCGAMGADVLLAVIKSEYIREIQMDLIKRKWLILATDKDLYQGV